MSESRSEQELELVERARGGDANAFMVLAERYRERLFRRAVHLLGSYDDAEDVLQESMIAAYQAVDRFRGESGIYTWFYRIVDNKCRDYARTRQRRMNASDGCEFQEALFADSRESTEKKVEQSEEAGYLIAKIKGLEKKYRQILLQRYYDDLSYQEIADLEKINVGTVKSRLFKARELLKRAILQDGRGARYFEDES